MPEDAAVLIVTRACPNCGAESSGTYCPQCGEMMEPRVLRIRHYLRDIAQEVLSLDTKLLNTIPALLFHPGFLAQEFVAGRRKRYLSPLRLHIIIGILFFLAFGYTLHTRMEWQYQNPAKRQQIDTVFSKIRQQQIAKGEKPTVSNTTDFKDVGDKVNQLMQEVGPYVLLVCSTPVFALFLWLLYRKRKLLYVEHLMFSLYFFSFAYLIAIPAVLWLHRYLAPVSAVLFCVYLYFALRRYYTDRGAKLVMRTLASIFACSFIVSFAFLISYVLAAVIGVMLGELPNGVHGVFNIHS
ncbi:MAG TPA: DUF3667 domain-containing protein [Candidatus Kapabacteria bacterium]|nr:DUF3667 domain-containing protein [Candidatus Kapabacteria bacterium]